MGVGEAVDARE
jgi:hypothetical protein